MLVGEKVTRRERLVYALLARRISVIFQPKVVSPVDHNIGARLKEIMSSYYHAALAANRDNWCNPPSQGGLQAWERRVFLAVWLARAWQQMQADNPTMFRAAFVHTGFLLAADGSEKHLIDIGVYDYNY
jgi:hypothetical protein